jgi:hypothetical protein
MRRAIARGLKFDGRIYFPLTIHGVTFSRGLQDVHGLRTSRSHLSCQFLCSR